MKWRGDSGSLVSYSLDIAVKRAEPFVGSSHEFVGAEHGNVNVSVFLLSALAGKGPGPHRHPYDEIQFVREGRGLWTVNGQNIRR